MDGNPALHAALNRFASLSVGVIGDLMVDRFIYGSAQRISPEAPVPVVHIQKRTVQPGGAANVGNNVLSLGARLSLFGVLGADDAGREARAILQSPRADLRGLLLLAHRPSTIKTRIVAQSQQVVRFDEEEAAPIDQAVSARLLKLLEQRIAKLDVLVLSDYAKGVFSAKFVAQLLQLSRHAQIPCIADPKPANIAYFAGVDVIKPNLSEALRLAGWEHVPEETAMPELCRQVRRRAKAQGVVITAGARGAYVLHKNRFVHLASRAREVYDVAGAGDTTLAALALGLAAGLPLADAARLGNLAGSIAVGKLGIAAVTQAELRAGLEASDGAA